ncbi:MAG: hypothetical protein AAB877_03590 [Patescibacteria group bacterium]
MVKDPFDSLPNPAGGFWYPGYYNCCCGKFLIHDPDDGGNLTLSPNVRQVPYNGNSILYWYGQVSLMVDYAKKIKALLNQGNYNYHAISPDINDCNFPPEPWEQCLNTEKVKYGLFYLPQSMEFEEVVLELDKENCRGALLREGLTFCNGKPEIHRKISMFIPGSFWRDAKTAYKTRGIPHIGKNHDVFLRQLDSLYEPGTFFLAVALQ